MEHDVFISYSTKNKEAAQAICHVLEQNEIRCWMAPRNIPPGSDYGDVIEDAIKACKSVVVLFSETAAQSQYVKSEINIAFEEQKTIIPFRLDETPLKGQNRLILNKTHWIDAYPDYKTKFNDLVAAVAISLGREIRQQPETTNIPVVIRHYKKQLIIAILLVLFAIALFFLYIIIVKQFHEYTYDKQGIHVRIKGLTVKQEDALTTIFDNMVHVEGGTFVMGNNPKFEYLETDQDSLSSIRHNVFLDNFYISKYELSQEQWMAFFPIEDYCTEFSPQKPIDKISWEDAVKFTEQISSLTGLQISLPTEAQWEYAARGGKCSRNYMFAGSNESEEVAWTCDDGITSAQEIGDNKGKRGNELNLYDMTGNVNEWCLDYYAPYSSKELKNPQGPQTGTYRICRGGDYTLGNTFDCKTTTRFFFAPFSKRVGTGLRLVINEKN